MMAALQTFGPDDSTCHTEGPASFGRALRRVLPEDEFDHQPLIGKDARYLLAADVRIDNRAEVANQISISSKDVARMSDADILLAAWERWQISCFDHLLGDIALAVWDGHQRRLTLGRSASSLKPLFYHSSSDFVAFASMPPALHALGIPKILDTGEAAAIAAGLPFLGSSTIFGGISLVRQGHAVEFSGGSKKIVRHWQPERIAPASFKGADYGDALRAELERAVTAQLRRRHGRIAAELSSGRDSSAVATTAALALLPSGEKLIALTGAPREGFSEPESGDRLVDESQLAAATTAAHTNIVHYICRPQWRPIGIELRRATETHFGPMINPAGLPWSSLVSQQASANGASILLIGSTGNYSISAGGPAHLVDLLMYNGLGEWWAQASRLGGRSLSKWRTIGNISLGPFLPQAVHRLLLRASGRDPDEGFDVPVLRAPYRGQAEQLLRDFFADLRPPRSNYEFRRKMLLKRENAEKMSEDLCGLDVRDPTADRRLIELCLSFPPEALVSANSPRPAFDSAFRDRIPPQVLFNQRRGRQGADWFELFRKDEISELFRQYGRNHQVRELFDLQYVDALIARLPVAGTGGADGLIRYQNELLGALALADFIHCNFPD